MQHESPRTAPAQFPRVVWQQVFQPLQYQLPPDANKTCSKHHRMRFVLCNQSINQTCQSSLCLVQSLTCRLQSQAGQRKAAMQAIIATTRVPLSIGRILPFRARQGRDSHQVAGSRGHCPLKAGTPSPRSGLDPHHMQSMSHREHHKKFQTSLPPQGCSALSSTSQHLPKQISA